MNDDYLTVTTKVYSIDNRTSSTLHIEDTYKFVSSKGWAGKIAKYIVKWLRSKNVLQPYYLTNTSYPEIYNSISIDMRKLLELLRTEIDSVTYDYGRVECIILGRDAIKLISYKYQDECFSFFTLETPYANPKLFGIQIRVIPWFQGILVVPKAD